MDVHSRLAQIRALVQDARSMPMSSSAVVNRAELIGLLDDLAADIEVGFSDAQSVVDSRQGVVDSARKEAELILSDARNERDRLASDTEVYRLAKREAEEILEAARTESAALRAETDEYVDAKFATFEIALERTMDAVKRGRDRLAGRTAMDSLTEDEADKIVLPAHLED